MPLYQLSEAAQEDLREIKRYTRETWGTAQAKTYLLELMTTFTKLARRPKMGRLRDDLGLELRSYVAGHHLVFYRQAQQGIHIARVLHSNMDVPQRIGASRTSS
jgi:toxin ParE1/3/4